MSDGMPRIETERPLATAAMHEMTRPGRHMMEFAFDLQNACLDELTVAGDEAMERLRRDMEIGAEFVARMACAHSVQEIATAFRDCGGHRAEALRRDSEQMLRHGQRFCERASKLWPDPVRS